MNRVAILLWIALALAGCASTSVPPPEIALGRRHRVSDGGQDKKIEGYVKVAYDVSVDGSVTNVRVVESDPPGVFDEAAVAAVRTWRFHPAIDDGKRW